MGPYRPSSGGGNLNFTYTYIYICGGEGRGVCLLKKSGKVVKIYTVSNPPRLHTYPKPHSYPPSSSPLPSPLKGKGLGEILIFHTLSLQIVSKKNFLFFFVYNLCIYVCMYLMILSECVRPTEYFTVQLYSTYIVM